MQVLETKSRTEKSNLQYHDSSVSEITKKSESYQESAVNEPSSEEYNSSAPHYSQISEQVSEDYNNSDNNQHYNTIDVSYFYFNFKRTLFKILILSGGTAEQNIMSRVT